MIFTRSSRKNSPVSHLSYSLLTLIELPRQPIKVTLPSGKELEAVSFESTPLSIAKSISNSLASSAVVARVTYSSKVA